MALAVKIRICELLTGELEGGGGSAMGETGLPVAGSIVITDGAGAEVPRYFWYAPELNVVQAVNPPALEYTEYAALALICGS